MFGSILVLFVLPWLDTSPVRSARFRPIYKWFFWVLLVVACRARLSAARKPPEGIWVRASRRVAHALLLPPLPVILCRSSASFERPLPLPDSISEPVLEAAAAAPARAPAKPMEKA